jgi:beta-lactamase class D
MMVTWKELGMGKVAVAAMLCLLLPAALLAATITNGHEARRSGKVHENASTERHMAAQRQSRTTAHAGVAHSAGRHATAGAKAAGNGKSAAARGEGANTVHNTARGNRRNEVRNSARNETRKTAARRTKGAVAPVSLTTRGGRRRVVGERFTASSFDSDPTVGDQSAGEDPIVRAAAMDALGSLNGTVVAIDPSNGRILAMVNQKLALSAGAQPCSTIKVPVALAALSEGLVTRETPVDLGGWRMNLSQALAHSNNQYFEHLGRQLGFAKVKHYAHEFGLGEYAGWEIEGEHLGTYPEQEIPASAGGVGKMCSFGEGVHMTPLQLGALMASIANGGTLFYLQHPLSQADVRGFRPVVKRYLNIGNLVPELHDGMQGATEYGTARSLRTSFTSEQVLGKTGTCSSNGTRYGWFASYANSEYGRIVTVIFLQGDRAVFGPRAAQLAGRFYQNLAEHNYFAGRSYPASSAALR